MRESPQNGNYYVIPRWFTWIAGLVMSCFALTAVPWVRWVTHELIDLEARMDERKTTISRFENLILDVQQIARDAAATNKELADIQRHLDRIERQIDSKIRPGTKAPDHGASCECHEAPSVTYG